MSKFLLLKQTQTALFEEKAEKLLGITRMLDENLEGNYDDILNKLGIAKSNSKSKKLSALNSILSPFARKVACCFPKLTVGYYSIELDAAIVYEPDEEPDKLTGAGIDKNDLGMEAVRKGREIIGIVNNSKGDSLTCARPLFRNGEAIGFVTANERIEDVFTQLMTNANLFSRKSWPVLNLNTFLWVISKIFFNSIHFRESINNQKYRLTNELSKHFEMVIRYIEVILNNQDAGVILFDSKQNSLFINKYMKEYLGLKKQNYSITKLKDIFTKLEIGNTGKFNYLMEKLINSSIFYDTLSVKIGGHEKNINITGGVIRYGESFDGYMLLLEDLCDLLDKEEKINQTEKLALVGELAASFAHEIRNPLTIVGGSIELIPEKIDDKDFLTSLAEITKRELGRVNKTVENLLEFIKYSEPLFVFININLLVNDCIDLVRVYAKSKKVLITESFFNELPEVFGDPEHLRQALLNLIINSFQAMTNGGYLNISTSYSPGSGYVKISIADTGKGIPMNIQEKVFNIFFTTKEYGTGLGLAIVKRIIDAHNGFIEFESKDTGTIFSIILPIKKAYY